MPLFLQQTISQAKPCTPKTIISLFISLPGYKPMQFFIFTPRKSPWDFNVHLSIVCKCIPIVTPPPSQPHPPPTFEEYKATKNVLWKICGVLRSTYQVSIKFTNGFLSKKLWFKTDLLPLESVIKLVTHVLQTSRQSRSIRWLRVDQPVI